MVARAQLSGLPAGDHRGLGVRDSAGDGEFAACANEGAVGGKNPVYHWDRAIRSNPNYSSTANTDPSRHPTSPYFKISLRIRFSDVTKESIHFLLT